VGFWFAGALALQCVTGIFFAWPHLIKAEEARKPQVADARGKRISLTEAWSKAQQAAPEGQVTHIKLPHKAKEAIEVRYKTAGDWKEEGNNRLFLAPSDGSVLRHDRWTEMSLARKIDMARGPVHFGRFLEAGWTSLAIRLLYVGIGIAPGFLFLSGALMYWNRSLSKQWAKRRAPKIGKLAPAAGRVAAMLCLAAGLESGLHAQDLAGVVVDASGGAIGGARVQLGNDSRRSLWTDAEGRFRFVQGEAVSLTLSVEAAGFEPVAQEIRAGSETRIVLAPAKLAVSVTVNAGTLDQLRLDEPVPQTSIGREDIASRNNRRLSDVVARMPGVYMSGPPGGDKDVRLRGLDKEFTRTQVDGVMIPDAGEKRELQLNRLPSFVVEKVTIVRNPSAEYESDGAAGRVDVETRPIPAGFRMDGRLGAGFREQPSRRLYNGQIAVGYRRNKLGFFGAFDHLSDPLYVVKDRRNSNGTAEIENERQLQATPNFMGDIGLFTERWGEFHLKPVLMRFATDVSKRRENFAASGAATALNTEAENKIALTQGLSLTHRTATSRGWLWSSQAALYVTDEDKMDKRRQSYRLVGGAFSPDKLGLEPEFKEDRTWNFQSAVAIPWRLGFSNEFKMGASVRLRDRFRDKFRYEIDSAGTRRELIDPKDRYWIDENYQGYFAQNRIRVGERLSFLPGLRYEQVDLFARTPLTAAPKRRFTDWNPSASVLYRIRNAWTVRAAVSRGLNRPKFDELSPFENEGTATILIGNPGLDPSRLWSYDVGTEFAARKATVAVNAFRKTIRGVIEQVDTGERRFGKNVLQVLNVGNGWISGFEFEQRLRMPSGAPNWLRTFSFWANQTWLDSNLKDFLGNERRFKEQPYWLSNNGLDYVEERTGTSVSMMANFVSARDELKLNMDTNRIGASASWDTAIYQRLRGRYRLFFEGNNLTNRQRLFDENFVNGTSIRRLEGYGRTMMIGLQFSL
jgi:outer membrane receptor protein involved in Fe transport